jgi:hypothetical protein
MSDHDSSEVLPTAPPPPQEVKVRTLKSDLASIAASGGGLPHYTNVKVEPKSDARKKSGGSGIFLWLAIVVLVVIIGGIAFYFIDQLVLKK